MSIHPASVHFPIALLFVGSALELWRRRKPGPAPDAMLAASRLMLRIGWWGALLAFATGLATIALDLDQTQRLIGWINGHVAASLAIIGVYWRLGLSRPLPDRTRVILLALGMALIVLTGWLGGALAHDLNWR